MDSEKMADIVAVKAGEMKTSAAFSFMLYCMSPVNYEVFC